MSRDRSAAPPVLSAAAAGACVAAFLLALTFYLCVEMTKLFVWCGQFTWP